MAALFLPETLPDGVTTGDVLAAREAFWAALDGEDPPCSQYPDLWFPEGKGGGTAREAKDVCRNRCRARAECYLMAILAGEMHGVWGGVTSPAHSRHKRRAGEISDSTRRRRSA